MIVCLNRLLVKYIRIQYKWNPFKTRLIIHDLFGTLIWSQLRAMLVLKGQSYGRDVILVDPRYTSQICSTCGHSDGKKPLDVRVWVCSNCGDTHDRDINAAINIRNIGLGQALVR